VQLLRTRAGDGKIVGHLYNFVYRGRVYCYQSGFARFADNRMKPGLVSHHLAIVMSRAGGLRYYDFLAGDSRYKRSLSNRVGEMVWIVMQRPALRFTIEHRLRGAKQRLDAVARRVLGRPSPPPGDG
jgi:CelD/BcsL family acetyltransferase involved in cellulose biosynthesis